ncbi:hypothetical protein Hdeb2414_s0021g00574131 [Helianthus debilis subsp. tardiflorus]
MKKSFTPLQKVTLTIKQLATGNPPDENDEYIPVNVCIFCQTICSMYAAEFLRRPTSHVVALLYQAHEEKHHLPGMLGVALTVRISLGECVPQSSVANT